MQRRRGTTRLTELAKGPGRLATAMADLADAVLQSRLLLKTRGLGNSDERQVFLERLAAAGVPKFAAEVQRHLWPADPADA